MRLADLEHARVAIWGYGREGRAALRTLHRRFPGKALSVWCGEAEAQAVRADAQAFAPQPLLADYMKQWIDHYRDCGGEYARLPGQRGAEQEQRAQHEGIELPASLRRELSALGTQIGRAHV